MAATTDACTLLHDEDAEKLLRLPAQVLENDLFMTPSDGLDEEMLRLEKQHIEAVNIRNPGYLDAEVQKLDAWADDLKVSLKNEVKELD